MYQDTAHRQKGKENVKEMLRDLEQGLANDSPQVKSRLCVVFLVGRQIYLYYYILSMTAFVL